MNASREAMFRKTVHCRTCDKWMSPLGAPRHRAMHRDHNETAEIQWTDGGVEHIKQREQS